MLYFSEREFGQIPRIELEISPVVWDGIASRIQGRVDDGSFGQTFPEGCPDNLQLCCGTSIQRFEAAMRSEIPVLATERVLWKLLAIDAPPMATIFDIIEFSWTSVGKPLQGRYHGFFGHHHLTFDKEAGQRDFRDDVNRIFRRNGLAFELTESGRIERIPPGIVGDVLHRVSFSTGDAELDELLASARQKFLSPDENEHRDALEKLWDAWERLKTINELDKRVGALKILDSAAGSNRLKFRDLLEADARSLTSAGNTLRIRHSETYQERLATSEQGDYLFYRMFSLMHFILRTSGSVVGG